MKDENVFCLKRADLEPLFGGRLPQGCFPGPKPDELLNLSQHFIPRRLAEYDSGCKQLIPYQLFCCRQEFFVYQRGGGVGEGRLAGRLSVGIGGHINSEDAGGPRLTPETYRLALLREREEELRCPEEISTNFIGWINDDANPVGQVHLGAVHLCPVESRDDVRIRKNGEDIHQVGWWTIKEIKKKAERFEHWSLLAVELARP